VCLVTGAALYRGQVMHARHRPLRRLFRYGVYMWLVDLDDLPRLPVLLRPLGSIRSRDHLGDANRTIRENVDAFLRLHDIDLGGGRVRMLANARVFGYVFNPLTAYWCEDADGILRCVVAEVHNTYGERHCYVLQPGDEGRYEADKDFYVSPFLTVDGRYRMSFSEPGERLNIQMELVQEGGKLFRASLSARRVPLTSGSLLRMAARYPLMTLRVTALIHLHGVALYLRGLPRVRRPRRPPQEGVG
jgi:DUF1365 family protein